MLQLPSLDDVVRDPTVAPAPPAPSQPSIAPIAGLKSGYYGALASFAGAVSGAAKIAGLDQGSANAGQRAAEYSRQAQLSGNPELEQQGFFDHGLGGFVSKAAYTAGQALPMLVGAGATGALAVGALPEEAALGGGALIGRIGASLPKLIGGSGLGAGFAADVAPEALVAGAKTAAGIGGAGLAMGVQSAGEQVNEAAQQPGGLTAGAAARAFAQGLPIGLVQGIVPGEGALVAKGGEALLGTVRRGMLATVADHAVKNAAAGAIGSGLQAAADTSFDPNMSAGERASRIVSAAVQGGEAGGLLGGVFGLLHRSPAEQQAAVDKGLGDAGFDPANPGGSPPPAPPAPAPEPVQQEFRFDRRLQDTALGTQPGLFTEAGEGDSKGTFLPYDPGSTVPRAARSDRDVYAEIKAARDARDQAAAASAAEQQASAPTPDPVLTDRQALRQPDAPPPNAYMRQVLEQANIGVGRGKGDFRRLVDGSTATTMPELYNELAAVDPTSAVAQTASFGRLASRLGVGEDDLEAQLQKLGNDPANAQARAVVNFKLGLRDAATRLREPEAPATPDVAPAAEAVAPAPAPPAAEAAPAAPADVAPTPAVKPPASEGVYSENGKLFGFGDDTAQITSEDLQEQLRALISDTPRRPQEPASAPVPADPNIRISDQGPRSIADQVLDAARSAVGDKGGEVSIADLRKALPDVAPKDFENALREIHGDDSDNALTQAPKGRRTGVDGVSVPGAGRFHNLEIEAREAQNGGVQERGAAPEVAGDVAPGEVRADGGGDAPGSQATGAGEASAEGEAQPAQAGAAPDQVAPPPGGRLEPTSVPADTRALLDPATYRRQDGRPAAYPGDAVMAKMVGVGPESYAASRREAGTAVRQRLAGIWAEMGRQKPDMERVAGWVRDIRDSDLRRVPSEGIGRDAQGRLRPVSGTERMLEELRTHAATPDAQAATEAAIAPQKPEQLSLDLGKVATTEGVLAAPDRPQVARVKRALRQRTKDQTSLLDTPAGDQVPTATVGGDVTDLPQASVSVSDPISTPSELTPISRMAQVLGGRSMGARRGYASEEERAASAARRKAFAEQGPPEEREPTPEELADQQQARDEWNRVHQAMERDDPTGDGEIDQKAVDRYRAILRSAAMADPRVSEANTAKARASNNARTSDLAQARKTTGTQRADKLRKAIDKPIKGAPIEGEMPLVAADRMPGVDPTILPIHETLEHYDRFVARLPQEVRDNVHLVGSTTPIEGIPQGLGRNQTGLYVRRRDGTTEVYLNADAVHSRAEIEDVLSHEVFGHWATNTQFKGPYREQAYQRRMGDVFNRAGGLAGIEKLARDLGVWKPGDGGDSLNGGAGLSAYFPRGGENLTPHETAALVDELIAHRAGVTPSNLDLAIQKVQGSFRSAIVTVMRRLGMHDMARRMDRFGQPELSAWVARSRQALTSAPLPGQVDLLRGATTPRHFLFGAEPTGQPVMMARLGKVQSDSEGVMGAVDALRAKLTDSTPYRSLFGRDLHAPGVKGARTPEALRNAGRVVLENLSPRNGIIEEAKRSGMPSLEEYAKHESVQRAIRTRLDGVGNRVGQDDLDIQSRDPAQARRLHNLMDVATSNNLDPLRPFSDHTWLRDVLSAADVEKLRPIHAQLQRDYHTLGQPSKDKVVTNGQQVYRDHVALGQMGWYMSRAMSTYDALKTVFDKVDTGYEPARRFAGLDDAFRERPGDPTSRPLAEDHYGNAQKARDYWKGEFERLTDLAEAHSTGEGTRPENAGTNAYADLSDLVKGNREGEAGYVKQGPYFRRGRSGDYAVGFKVAEALDAEGKGTGRPDPAALQALKDGFAKDFPQVSIGANDANRQVFARFPSQEVASNFAAKVQEGGELRRHIDQEHGTHVSLLSDADHMDGAVPFLKQHLDAAAAKFDAELEAMPAGDPQRKVLQEQRTKYLGLLRATILDMSGDNSVRSLQAARENVQGSNADMLENNRAAAQTVARAAALTSVRAEKAQALFDAREAVRKAGTSQQKNALNKSVRMQRLLDAFNSRNTAADVRMDNSFLSTAKQILHSYQLGASPAYIVMNASQLGTLTVPELAKTHSYARVIPAMTGSLGDVGKVVAAMVRTGGAIQGGITRAVLDGAGLSPEKRNFISNMANHDHLELGSYSAAESGLGVGNLGSVTKWMHFANSTALLAETASRLSTAFAAKKLYDEMPAGQQRDSLRKRFPTAEDYAGHVVKETMMEWGSHNSPKLFTAGGAFGKAGPLVTQFHGWVPRIIEKVYRESMDGFTKRLGEGPEADAQRAEARRFVMSHMAAVIALSGSLGLPMAGYTAAAATRLSGLFYDQPYDVEAHMRGFLANTFGKDVGEIVSRGLPRYLGVDMEDLGDTEWGPLSKLMESREKLEDAWPEYLAHAWGSAPAAGLNMALGIREMAEGRFSEAMARSLPTSMRNIVRAYQVSQRGYVNSLGEPLPVPAGATEVLKTALGMQSGQLAEERERQEAVQGLKADRAYRKSKIERDYSLAIGRNDAAGRQAAVAAARDFDHDNPGEQFSQQLAGFAQKRASAIALANRLGTMGVDPKDRVARMLTGF